MSDSEHDSSEDDRNRRPGKKHGSSPTVSPTDSLKWRPGESGAVAKARAKAMRKLVEQRVNAKEEKRVQAQARRRSEARSAPGTPVTPATPATPTGTRREQSAGKPTALPVMAPMPPLASPICATSAEHSARPRLYELVPPELWLEILLRLGARELCLCACVCTGLATVVATDRIWLELHFRVYSSMPGCVPSEPSESASEHRARLRGPSAHRLRLAQSEMAMNKWATVSRPSQLALPLMTTACLSGGLGVSTHVGGFLRVWVPESGRRISCSRKQRHELTCCFLDAGSGLIATGDTAGLVHIFHAETTLDRCEIPPKTLALRHDPQCFTRRLLLHRCAAPAPAAALPS